MLNTRIGTISSSKKVASGGTLLLDNHMAEIAYYLWLQNTNYSNPLAWIRRGSDDDVESFYPDSNGLLSLDSENASSITLADFITTDHGYFYKIGNQGSEGSGADLVQATLGDQWQIINAGALNVNDDGFVAAMIPNNYECMSVNYAPSSSEFTMFFDIQYEGSASQFLVSWDDDSNKRAFLVNSGAWSIDFGAMTNGPAATSSVRSLVYALINGSNSEMAVDGAAATAMNADATSVGTRMDIMGRDGGNNSLQGGYFSGMVLYDSNKKTSRSSIETYIL